MVFFEFWSSVGSLYLLFIVLLSKFYATLWVTMEVGYVKQLFLSKNETHEK